MKNDQILDRLQEIFRDVLNDQNLTILPKMSAEDIEDWDSLSHVNLIVSIQKDFKIKFKLGEVETLNNIGDMIELIKQKI